MVLSSLKFIILFLFIFAAWQLCPRRWRWAALLAANAVFYAQGATPALWWCLAASILLSWGVGLALERAAAPAARRALLALGAAGLLGFLAAFKYLGFFTGGRFALGLAQPVGIAFYTLQTLGYLIDVFRGRLPAERHLGFYAAYVSFFATLTSGPVTRAQELLPQLRAACRPDARFDGEKASNGLVCFLFGLFEKCALADFLNSHIAIAVEQPEQVLGTSLLVASVLYSFRIYFDFAGYSNMALGLGRMLGLELEQNFRQPYFAVSVRDFWSRWHISLSHWLRDYIYIPLGGSRCGTARVCLNLLLTFLVSGLWHGAGLCFLVWGGLHGVYRAAGRLTRPLRSRLYAALHLAEDCLPVRLWRMAVTFALVTFAWLFFNVGTAGGSLGDALALLARMADSVPFSLRELLDGCALLEFHPWQTLQLGGLLLAAFIPDFCGRRTSPGEWLCSLPPVVRCAACWLFLLLVFLFNAGTENFIYFAFT